MEQRRAFNSTLNEALIKGKLSDTLAVFDLDDTLIISSAKINVLDPNTGEILKSLTPAEFNFFKPVKGSKMSFEEFESYEILKKAHFIMDVLEQLKDFYTKGVHVSIVTARSNSAMIRRFFYENGIDIHPDLVIAVNDPQYGFKGSIAERKKQALNGLVEQGYSDFIFFDDNEENLSLAKEIEKEKDVTVKTVKV
jgi:hypothetical protein